MRAGHSLQGTTTPRMNVINRCECGDLTVIWAFYVPQKKFLQTVFYVKTVNNVFQLYQSFFFLCFKN